MCKNLPFEPAKTITFIARRDLVKRKWLSIYFDLHDGESIVQGNSDPVGKPSKTWVFHFSEITKLAVNSRALQAEEKFPPLQNG